MAFFMELEFLKLEFKKNGKLLNILKCKIFWPKMIIFHFGLQNFVQKFRVFPPQKKRKKEKEKRALAMGIDVVQPIHAIITQNESRERT